MNLYNYARASNEHATEILQTLEPEEVKLLADELRGHGLAAWNTWQEHNLEAVSEFLALTPAARKKSQYWKEGWLRGYMVLAGYRQAYAASKFLYQIAAHGLFLSEPKSQRDTTARAGTMIFELKGISIPDWPDEYEMICPSPFQSDQ